MLLLDSIDTTTVHPDPQAALPVHGQTQDVALRQPLQAFGMTLSVEPMHPFTMRADDQVSLMIFARCKNWRPGRPWIFPVILYHSVSIPFLNPAIGQPPIPAPSAGKQEIQLADGQFILNGVNRSGRCQSDQPPIASSD